MHVEYSTRESVHETRRENSHETGEDHPSSPCRFDDVGNRIGELIPTGVILPEHLRRVDPSPIRPAERRRVGAVTHNELDVRSDFRRVDQGLEIRPGSRGENSYVDEEPPRGRWSECRQRDFG